MRDPLDGRRKLGHQLLVEYADAVGRDVVPVDANDTVILAPRLQTCEELVPIASIHDLHATSED